MNIHQIVDVVGWIGALSVLIAYLMLSLNKWESQSVPYQGMNLFGGLSLIINTIYFGAYPSTLVNLVWVGIALYSLARRRVARGPAAQAPEDVLNS